MTDCLPVTLCSGSQTYQTPMLKVGDSANIPNTHYTIKVVSIFCNAPVISDNYTDVELYRSGALITTCRYYIDPGRNQLSSDLGYICIYFTTMDCRSVPPAVGFDVYSTPLLGNHELRVKFLKLPGATEAGLRSVLDNVIAVINGQVTILGYTYTGYSIDWNNSTFSLWYTGQSPAIPIATILGLIAVILIAVSILVVGLYFLIGAMTQQQVLADKDTAKKTLDDDYNKQKAALDAQLASGQITPAQYQTQLDALNKQYNDRLKTLNDYYSSGIDWNSMIMWGAVALIGYGIVQSGLLSGKSTRRRSRSTI